MLLGLSKTNALAVEEDELQSLSDHSPVPHHETSKMTGAGVDFLFRKFRDDPEIMSESNLFCEVWQGIRGIAQQSRQAWL